MVALHGVNLDVPSGDFLSIEGPSGSGKSTLLLLLGALEVPTAGSICFDGQRLDRAGDAALTRMRAERIGFVFQQFNLVPTLTAADNVAVAMVALGTARAERRERARSLLEQVGLEHRTDHLPSRLSGGEQQRVAIARALANRPQVIVADEPTGNLDSANAAEIMRILSELQDDEHPVTIVVATHDEGVATRARRRIRLRDGTIVDDVATGT